MSSALWQAYEQWDGKGPRHVRGAEIPLPARLVSLAATMEVLARRHGTESARKVARRKAGAIYDPALANLFVEHADSIVEGLDEAANWDAVLASCG